MKIEAYLNEKLLSKNELFLFTYWRGCLYIRDAVTKCLIKKKRIHNRVCSISLVERMLRYEPRVALSLNDNTFIYTDHGAIYQFNVRNNTVTKMHSFLDGMNNPLSFCVRYSSDGSIQEVLYGEYFQNDNKRSVSIYRYDFRTWKKIYSFPAGSINHIHNISYDCFKNRYIIATGDSDAESTLWQADTEFLNVSRICGGCQKYRACAVFPAEDGIYYATDTPLEQNWIYFLNNELDLFPIFQLPGPCIFGRVYGDSLFLSTAVEADPTIRGWRYLLSNNLGVGVHDRQVHIVKCSQGGKVEEIGCFMKDRLPMGLFQLGNAQFPSAKDAVYVTTQSTIEKGTYKLVED